MNDDTFTFEAIVWEDTGGHAPMRFLDVPPAVADEIEATYGHRAAGFGSIKVEVAIGGSTWSTSLFPSDARKTYVLPVKKPVRQKERIDDGDTVAVRLTVTV